MGIVGDLQAILGGVDGGKTEMKKKCVRSILAIMICSFLTSCATPALWNATDPQHCIVVPKSDAMEQQLKAKGISYYGSPKGDVLFVDKTAMQKDKDYLIRTLATPVTVVLDAGVTVVVVGVLAGPLVLLGSHGANVGPLCAIEGEGIEHFFRNDYWY